MAGDGGASGAQRERVHVTEIKTGAIKQIEAWAKSGREMKAEGGRNVGRLNDNVTEERMLQARIWDLSRERYKFLSQAEYEKRTFLDRQLRKSAICREITRSLEVGKGAEGGGGEMKRALERRESVKSFGRSNFVGRPEAGDDRERAPHLPRMRNRNRPARLTDKTSSSEDVSVVGGHASGADAILDRASSSRMFPTEPVHPIRYKSNLAMREALSGNIRSAPVKRRISFADDRNSAQPRPHHHRPHHHHPPHPGRQEPKPTEDPRYQMLERCLCEKWNRKGVLAAPEVAGVIKSNPSLYTPPKRSKDRKSSIAEKFLQLLSEQGWVF